MVRGRCDIVRSSGPGTTREAGAESADRRHPGHEWPGAAEKLRSAAREDPCGRGGRCRAVRCGLEPMLLAPGGMKGPLRCLVVVGDRVRGLRREGDRIRTAAPTAPLETARAAVAAGRRAPAGRSDQPVAAAGVGVAARRPAQQETLRARTGAAGTGGGGGSGGAAGGTAGGGTAGEAGGGRGGTSGTAGAGGGRGGTTGSAGAGGGSAGRGGTSGTAGAGAAGTGGAAGTAGAGGGAGRGGATGTAGLIGTGGASGAGGTTAGRCTAAADCGGTAPAGVGFCSGTSGAASTARASPSDGRQDVYRGAAIWSLRSARTSSSTTPTSQGCVGTACAFVPAQVRDVQRSAGCEASNTPDFATWHCTGRWADVRGGQHLRARSRTSSPDAIRYSISCGACITVVTIGN